jgi:SAM-dependent methyltransferase
MLSVTEILPRSISKRLLVYQLGRKVKRHESQKLKDLPAVIQKAMDPAKMRKLWQEVGPEYDKSPTSAAKYAMPAEWLLLNTLRAGKLGLHTSSGLRIMDIGCGPAYFMAVTRALGHETEGVDAPESYLTPVERRVYRSLIDILGCTSHVNPLLIERHVPLPFPESHYDLITAFWICFNRHRQSDEWGKEEWRFFVEDALTRLRPGGRLFLDLNENPERYGALRFYDQPTLEYFQSVGNVEQGSVLITKRK